MPTLQSRTIAILATVSTYLFWLEYLPPFTRVHLYSDIEGFHWPLFIAAFEALREGRVPLWDASIYCGMPFAGNIQAALFYPPTWLLYAASLPSKHVLFKMVEAWVFLHAWLAFFMCYLWLRNRRLSTLASLLGASVFAFGGYMVSQNNHVGVVTGYAWMPLAWLGIDEALQTRSTRPMWKVVAASAMCFLAGYVPSFGAFAATTMVYAVARSWRTGIAAIAAIAVSLAVAAVELLPAVEASALKTFDPKLSPGIRDPLFYVHFVVPDWAGLQSDPHPYLYLGVPALFGIAWLIKRRDGATLAVLAACALFLTNPYDLTRMMVAKSTLLVQVFSNFQFVAPATLVFAFVAANGIDGFLQSEKGQGAIWPGRKEFEFGTVALLVAWSVYRLWVWPRPVVGWRSVAETGVMVALYIAGLFVIRQGRTWATILLCAAVFVDYKVCGTSRPFSSTPGDEDAYYQRGTFDGVDTQAYDILRDHRQYRLALDAIHPTDLRRYGLATPQGFDPLIALQYKTLIERYEPFRTNRLFDIPPHDEALLQLVGVRYFLTRDGAPFQAEVESNYNFRLVGPRDSFVKVYEYTKAAPPWRWYGAGEATAARWEPGLREFQVSAREAGRFVLAEQFYPGWQGSVDGRSVSVQRWDGVFQAITVPRGQHTVRFEYRPASVQMGAAISIFSLMTLTVWLWRSRARAS